MRDFFSIDPMTHALGVILVERLNSIVTLPHVLDCGRWTGVNTQPFIDRCRSLTSRVGSLSVDYVSYPGCVWGCANYFPEDGGMDWHTDSHRPGWRLYAHKLVRGDALFYYRSNVVRETPGVGAYVFRTGLGCWHGIETFGPRLSLGLKIPEEMAYELFPE